MLFELIIDCVERLGTRLLIGIWGSFSGSFSEILLRGTYRQKQSWKRRVSHLSLGLYLFHSAACLSPSGGGSEGTSTDGPTPNPSSTATATPTPIMPGEGDCPQLLSGDIPVGLACMHCSHARAQEQAMVLAQIMRDSCRLELATNFLIDGRFGNDEAFITDFINFLSKDRELSVIFYLTNGVSQRLGDPYNPNIFGTGTSVESFRHKIINDPSFRFGYQEVVQRALRIKAGVTTGTVRFILIPGLEDNLTDSIYRNVLALTQEVGGNEVSYGRSICPGCADGNGTDVPEGVLEQTETGNIFFNTSNGIITNDNSPFLFQYESGSGLRLADLAQVRIRAHGRNDIFILWNPQYQGLPVEDNKVIGRPDPSVRNYAVPNLQEYQELVGFLTPTP